MFGHVFVVRQPCGKGWRAQFKHPAGRWWLCFGLGFDWCDGLHTGLAFHSSLHKGKKRVVLWHGYMAETPECDSGVVGCSGVTEWISALLNVWVETCFGRWPQTTSGDLRRSRNIGKVAGLEVLVAVVHLQEANLPLQIGHRWSSRVFQFSSAKVPTSSKSCFLHSIACGHTQGDGKGKSAHGLGS